jgi:predicted permease
MLYFILFRQLIPLFLSSQLWVFTFQTLLDTAIQFGIFYGLIIVGYVLARISSRGKALNKQLTRLLVSLFIPVLFIYTFLTSTPDSITEIQLIMVLALMIDLLGPILMFIRLWKSNIDDSTKGVFYLCVTFNNALFIPLPLVLLFIGSAGLSVVIIFSFTQMLLLATLGSFMGAIYGSKTSKPLMVVKDALTFPPFLAALLALILFSLHFRIPDDLAGLLAYTGPITTYLALISVGIGIGIRFTLAEIRAALEVVGIRQFIVPLILIPVILLSGLSHLSTSILILEALMPPAVLTVVYATSFKLDAEKAATIVTVGTLFLLPIIPFIPLLLG